MKRKGTIWTSFSHGEKLPHFQATQQDDIIVITQVLENNL